MKIFILILAFTNCLFSDSIKDNLNKIPKNERKYLEYFFMEFVYYNNLAFIFLQDKPAALLTHSLDYLPNCYYPWHANTDSIRGWIVWKKYEHLFSHPNFIFTEDIKNQDTRDIFVINKISLLHVLKRERERFAEKLGETFSPEEFVKKLEETKHLYPFIHYDDELLGIILGFGAESSRKFVEMHDQLFAMDPTREERHVMSGVVFIGDPNSQEVQKLRNIYQDQRDTLYRLYKNKDCLRTTLLLLSQEKLQKIDPLKKREI